MPDNQLMAPGAAAPRLSKSRYVAGAQCEKLLWLKVHERDAPELKESPRLRDLYDQGNEVGALARARFPGGVMVEGEHDDPGRLERTRALIEAGTPVIFEATFIADRTYAAVDVLLKDAAGYTLIEVKSGSDVKDRYVTDAAVQAHVARRSGVNVNRVEIMHLNPEYTHGGRADLFVRTDVTRLALELAGDIPVRISRQLEVLSGPLPAISIGEQCRAPYECAFMGRCWPLAHDSVLNIHGLKYEKRFELHHGGVPSIAALPADFKLNDVQRRQRRAIETNALVVERTLAEALAPFRDCRLGFMDFETVSRAVPRWDGTRPWQQIGVQWSYHERQDDGGYLHREYIAEPDCDPRHDVARALIEATRDAERIAMYTPFERTQLRMMQEMNPDLAEDLAALEAKLVDLKKVVHYHVYHPLFAGSFSLKEVLPALAGIDYKDTVTIADGEEASVKLARLLFYTQELSDIERARLRRELLEYCRLDTWAMVRVLETLETLAASRTQP